MANPAPVITVLPAFNVNVGVTIDFNIIGGVNVVRSNKLYVYNMNNELIFTHLYVSTESVHELPRKTDPSIIYASGKSASNFNNKTSYYACIQTFTDVSGSEGASGFSTAKQFWALPTPSLTFDTIPASIQNTSYNFTAIYTNGMSSGDSADLKAMNLVQQYQFDLYKAGGNLIRSTGVLVGQGEQQGTSTTYHLSYNFSGLENNTTYYVVVSVTTTTGAFLTSQSSSFAVNISAPTLGSATVTNNACGGYISIESNLSSLYSNSINKILVKRLDRSNIANTWLTLFSIPINQSSDMDFTVVDFFNRYGREYQYALVPIIVQEQSGIEVEVEGNYTLSNIVVSKFDGVFIADNTAIQKFQAGVNYNGVNLKQSVGVIETIGNQYPIIVSNNNLKYHSGSISAYALHEGFYSTQSYESLQEYRYSRVALVAVREAVEKFLTNKSPKILKDWNGNMWLVMFTSDIDLEFTNQWGMGIAIFSASWTEIGNAEDQYDLQNSGLINIGGV